MYVPALRSRYNETLQTLQAYQAAVNEAAIVSITDLKGVIIYVNEKFTEVSKYTAEELIGNTHRIINSSYHSEKFFRQMWQTIKKGKHWRGEIKNKAKDGTYYWVDTVITPLLDQKGRIFQYLSVRNLITAQKENEEKLISIQNEITKREQQLKDAQEVAKTGSWYFNTQDNILEWSAETYHIFEIPVGTNINYELFLQRVHPADRNKVDKEWRSALKNGVYEIEHRIITPSGEKWVSEKARFEFNKSKIAEAAIGTVQDITERKKIEVSIRESESLYKNIFNYSPFAIGIFEKKTSRLLEVNDTATELYGYSREEFLKLTAYDIRVEEEHSKLKTQLSGENYARDKSISTHIKKNGEIFKVEPSISEINYKGKIAYLITIKDVTEKIKLQDEINLAKRNRQKEIVEAQEKSRSEVGMELHDNINQLLAASGIYLKNVHAASERDKKLIDTGINIIAMANEEIRRLSASLVPPSLYNQSLAESIENFTHSFKETGITYSLNIKINEETMPEGLKINIYRIIQEQFNNIIKYAEATKVKIALIQSGNSLTLDISDNGKGFNLEEKSKGIGLTNIIYRAEAYNGKAYIKTGEGHGCKIKIEFMLSPFDKAL
ncbi:PAS domain S-box protein [Ginsengibacter hankyongi]|uniref:histidine kinase n=1 Tax=Ginsengibacter hankyongi TaxID=2607284 RepID=A0A5J5IGF4_9BACT|nr:PAS domain-containing sensor histidine kinase [Ginsengibacter hankyongi]KAA9038150.1 PAS domain S-box protein [Ginsengibacter hankyongi]